MAEAGQNRPRHYPNASVEVSVLHSAILRDNLRTLEEAVGNIRKEGRLNENVSDPAPLQLADEESDSVQAHLNEYESLSSQITSQGTTIEDELRAMILMSSLPSWETFVTTVCNASTTAIKYSEVTSAILTEAARRKSFTKGSAEEVLRA